MALKYFNVINGITVGNITLDATTGNATVTNLAVTGNANLTAAANVALGSNSNVKLTGGSSGQYLQTDGNGNLSWQSISSATAIANGTSNVSIPTANGNVVVSVNGVANIATFTSNAVFRGSYGLTGIISQSNTAPASPQNGDQWYNTFNGILFEYLDDGTSSQWVDISSLPLPNLSTSNASAVLNNVQTTGTYFPAFISSTANGNYALSSNTAFSANLANGALIATTFVGALSGAATSATTAGTVTTAAQPNITSVGTLTSLGVTGNASAGNLNTAGAVVASTLTSNVITGTAPLTVTSTTRVANLNVDYANVADNINVAAGTGNNFIVFANAATGNVAELTSTGLTANLSNNSITATTFVGALSGAATSATTAGTVTTAAQPNITSVGTLTSLGVTGNISSGNANLGNAATANFFIGSGNNLSNIQGANVTGAVAFATTANAVAGANVSGQVANALVAGTVYTAAQPNITSVGTLTALTVDGIANVTGNILAGGVVAATGNVSGGNLTTAGALNVTGNANVGNIGATNGIFTNNVAATGSVSGSLLTGALTTAAQPNITSVGTLTSATVTGNVAAGNLTTTGVLSVTGTGVSSIAGNLDMTSNTIINLATPTNSTDAATKQYVDDVAQGLNIHASCNAATQTTLASISGGTVTYNNGTAGVGATLTTTGSYTTIDGVTLSDGMRILVKNESTTANNGIYVRTSATVLTRATDFDTAAEIAGGDFTFVTAGTLYNSTGWVQIDEVTTVGTDPIVWEQFSGAGTYQAGTGLTLTGTTFSVNASQTQVTAVGTLTGLNSSGTITAPAFTANTGVFTGNGSGLSAIAGANVTGTVASATAATNASALLQNTSTATTVYPTFTTSGANGNSQAVINTGISANLGNASITATTFVGALSGAATSATTAGTVTTNAQPNITSVGTLTSLAVTGNATAGNVYANSGTIGASLLTGTLTTAAQPNITSVGTLSTATITTGNITTINSGLLQNGNSNITITANSDVTINSKGGLTLRVTDAGAAVTGTLNSTGAITTTRLISNVATGTAPLTVTSTTRVANLNVAYANVADNINVTEPGTGTGYVVFANATSGNVAEWVSSGITSNLANNSITATTFVGALSGAATTAGTVTTAAQPNITSVGTLTALSVSTATGLIGLATDSGGALSLGLTNGNSSSPYIDFNTSNTAVDFNVRLAASGPSTGVGAGTLTISAGTTNVAGTLQTTALTTGANSTAGTVTGNWTLTAGSRWQATYADLAEKYAADNTYEPGTVLLFGGEQEVTLSNAFDSTKVAGVVTTNPAYSMNAMLEAEYVAEIALQGRVPCKVIGPIEKGDLMVSASNGHATANNDARAGTIIGKALENFNGDFGVIEVAVGRF